MTKPITMTEQDDNITIYGHPLPDNGKDYVIDVELGNAPSSNVYFVPWNGRNPIVLHPPVLGEKADDYPLHAT